MFARRRLSLVIGRIFEVMPRSFITTDSVSRVVKWIIGAQMIENARNNRHDISGLLVVGRIGLCGTCEGAARGGQISKWQRQPSRKNLTLGARYVSRFRMNGDFIAWRNSSTD